MGRYRAVEDQTQRPGTVRKQDRPTGELVKDMSEQISHLVRDEAIGNVKADVDEVKERAHR
jgi:hypothetical protein